MGTGSGLAALPILPGPGRPTENRVGATPMSLDVFLMHLEK